MKALFKFEVPGNPCGYTTTTSRDKGISKRYRKYKDYCKRVREYASAAGVPIPLEADRDAPLFIKIKAYFRNGVHADVENVRKGCVDALFYDPLSKRKGNDKWVAGEFSLPLYDKEDPRLDIEIYLYETQDLIDGE